MYTEIDNKSIKVKIQNNIMYYVDVLDNLIFMILENETIIL